MNIRAKPHEDMLQLDGLVTTKVDRTSHEDEIFVYAQPTGRDGACMHCAPRPTKVHGHGTDIGRFKDVTLVGKKATVVVQRRRFRCTACARTWTERVPSLHERRMMTTRLEEHVALQCFRGTFMDVAREHGIDEGTVRAIFADFAAARAKTHQFQTPRVLGIDEIHLAQVPCVLVDVGRRRLFDILPERTKDKVGPYLASMADKQNVEVVVADMWRPYHALADQFFPGRLVVVDKFHVLRMAHDGLDAVRKAVGRTRSTEQRLQLKDERFLLFRRRRDLTEAEAARIKPWLRAFPMLRAAYEAKERLTDAYDEPNRKLGQRAIEKCLQLIPVELDPFFRELQIAVSNWKERICNYFDDPVTNAYTESVNSLIRELDRVGRGYAFETMRALMLYDPTERSKKTSTRARKPTIPDDAFGLIDMSDFSDDDDWPYIVDERGPHIDDLLRRLALDATVEPEDDG